MSEDIQLGRIYVNNITSEERYVYCVSDDSGRYMKEDCVFYVVLGDDYSYACCKEVFKEQNTLKEIDK